MGLNLLEYDTLRRIRSATESLAANSTNTVSLDRYMQLDGVCRELAAIARKMETERDSLFRDCNKLAKNRDEFAAWGDVLARQLEEMRLRAERAEAELVTQKTELAALKAALAQGGQG